MIEKQPRVVASIRSGHGHRGVSVVEEYVAEDVRIVRAVGLPGALVQGDPGPVVVEEQVLAHDIRLCPNRHSGRGVAIRRHAGIGDDVSLDDVAYGKVTDVVLNDDVPIGAEPVRLRMRAGSGPVLVVKVVVPDDVAGAVDLEHVVPDRKSTRLNS